MYVVKNTHLPVYVLPILMFHQTLNTDPMSCIWIGHFSGLWQLGADVPLPASADSCSFPSSCPLTVEPCVASTSPEYPHSCSYLTLSSQTLCVSLHPSIRLLSSSQETSLFICGTFAPLLCLCFPSPLLSAGVLVGYKLQHYRVKTLLYSKHLATFPYPETWVIIQHLISLCILKYPSHRPTTAYKS